ncbi:hypothetical protein AMTR_s00071p00178710 [Amborella trichopoda]|uniref:Uncharacterized protein n=1 Tax=Amborella trichopoda TaxID=13333 RepID=U5DC12_AMBTC|nr:hypothetical protein AMTR_s00071p00178710 [Amborella trichopoda]
MAKKIYLFRDLKDHNSLVMMLMIASSYWIPFKPKFEDLPILCERHTTSKLSAYEDLQSIKSMGFKGEALASMTFVGHVTVTTITEGHMHGYRVSYRDGVMEYEPRPCATVKGTQIMVENLFYNMTARRKTLQSSNDDYTKIVDLISRFAIHNVDVSFSCRKHGMNRADVHPSGSCSRLEAIRSVCGLTVACDLMEITASDDDPSRYIFKMNGFISNANYIAKKTTMVLYINGLIMYGPMTLNVYKFVLFIAYLGHILVECMTLSSSLDDAISFYS